MNLSLFIALEALILMLLFSIMLKDYLWSKEALKSAQLELKLATAQLENTRSQGGA